MKDKMLIIEGKYGTMLEAIFLQYLRKDKNYSEVDGYEKGDIYFFLGLVYKTVGFKIEYERPENKFVFLSLEEKIV